MYAKLPFGTLLALAGIAALPEATPLTKIARTLLEITGIGFGIYLVAAIGLVFAGVRMRRSETTGMRAGRFEARGRRAL
jgi:hypothetical protein